MAPMPVISDWDDAYANAPHIPDGDRYPERWLAEAARFRAALPAERRREGLPYGRGERERVDVFLPEGPSQGVVVFVHGGWWRAFGREHWSHLAAGPLGRGWTVAIPGYPLAPDARIAEVARSISEAVTQIAAAFAGPIALAGHSAGGHLVARQVCEGALLPARAAARIGRTLPISGLFDLRPLLRLAVNAELRIDEAEAQAESPALLAPRAGARVHVWCGADERPEFVRQSELLANVGTGLRAERTRTRAPGRHHYDVIAPLADPGSDLVAALVG
jgi:arylformamidase